MSEPDLVTFLLLCDHLMEHTTMQSTKMITNTTTTLTAPPITGPESLVSSIEFPIRSINSQ